MVIVIMRKLFLKIKKLYFCKNNLVCFGVEMGEKIHQKFKKVKKKFKKFKKVKTKLKKFKKVKFKFKKIHKKIKKI